MKKVEIKEVAPCRREMLIEVPADEMKREFEQALERISRRASIPGFRPGRAPRSLAAARFGDVAREEVLEKKLAESFSQACREREISMLGAPSLSEVRWKPEEPLCFKASFDIKPVFALGQYRGLKLKKPPITPRAEEVEDELENLRKRSATFESVEGRPLRDEDFAIVDYRALVPGEASGSGEWKEGIPLEVAAAEGMKEKITGMNIDEVRQVEFPARDGDPEGAPRNAEIRLREIKRRVLPELDDKLASSWGPFRNLTEVREKIEAMLRSRKERDARSRMEEEALDRLLAAHDFDLPPEALASLTAGFMKMFQESLRGNGGLQDEQVLKTRAAELGERELKTIFILREIAVRERIAVSPAELGQEIAREAAERGEEASAYRRRLENEDRIGAIEDRIERRKALDLVLEAAEIEEAGNE